MGRRSAEITLAIVLGALVAPGCKDHAPDAAPAAVASAQVGSGEGEVVISQNAKLAATAMTTSIYAKPTTHSPRIGYLRLGAIVPRSDKSYGNADGCPGGWYAVAPRGFVCTGRYATLDLDTPLVRAASVRPDTQKPLPYAYGWIRYVTPLYTRMPSRLEQLHSEYKLKNHFKWFEAHREEEQRIARGANDFAREVMPDLRALPPQEGLADVRFFGGKTDEDPPPFWIEHGNRSIPNVTGFDQQPESFFLNIIKRHTGVAFVGAFDSGPELDHRKFGVTADMRLVPLDKVKPETGSTFHGVEIVGDVKLPVGFARPCATHKKSEPFQPCRHVFRPNGDRMLKSEELLPPRAFLRLTGTRKVVNDVAYWETTAGYWLREKDLCLAVTPHLWPAAAQRGEKWIDVSIDNETLVAWDGKKPVFVTLVSAGQDGPGDPKTTKSTVRGVFRIRSKHITTTMDSNERSKESGGEAPSKFAGEAAHADDEHASSFELRDVPYVQYFHDGYALHTAYWHDRFGWPRSHGCINLSPIDAMRLFRFTEPSMPPGWHGVVDETKGTTVIVRR